MNEIIDGAGLELAEYLDHRSAVGPDQVLWENNGWSVRGLAGGRDFLLWVSPYLLRGHPGGAFRIGEAALSQTLLIVADDVDSPLDTPNGFRSAGWEPDDFRPWSSWTVTPGPGRLDWDDGSRRFRADRGGWRISGEHAGVDLDVRLVPDGPAMWLTPPGEPISDRQDRWWIANATATGVMRVDGQTWPLTGHALHERHIHLGTRYNPVSLLRGDGVTWHSGSAPGLRYAFLARPSLNRCWGIVHVDGHTVQVRDPNQVDVRVTERWVDPATGFSVPRAWSVRVESGEVGLDVRITAHARAYYLWDFLRDGVTVLYWWLSTARGEVRSPSGSRNVSGISGEAHQNRTFYERPVRPLTGVPWS